MQVEIIHQSGLNSKKQSLLFIHGMWHGAWCWAPHFLPFFADIGYDTYALSLRNHGKSGKEKPIWRVRIKEYVEDVRQAVASIEGDPILVGHSMGGFVIQKYLEKYQVERVVLLTPVPIHGILGATLKVLKKYPFTFLKANLLLNLAHIIADKKKAKALLFSTNIPDDKLEEYHAKLQNEAHVAYIEMMGFSLPKIKKIQVPKMLVIGAENDAVISAMDIQKTANAYGAKVVMVPNIAHDVMLDVNWKAVAQELANWLD